MTHLQLQEIINWFSHYTRTFTSNDSDFSSPIQLKVDHSQKVANNARQLAEESGWNSMETNMAEALGWLHDIGRFSQFAEFGTFSDAASVNHGERGWEVVRQSGILAPLESTKRTALLDGIRYHNAKTEPDHLTKESLRFLKLIRDADKLDILRFVLESVQKDGFQALPGMLPQVVLDAPLSPQILSEIQQHRSCSIKKIHSLADFLLMQLAWIYDLNFPATFRLITNRHIIDDLERSLPKTQPVQQLVQNIRAYALQSC